MIFLKILQQFLLPGSFVFLLILAGFILLLKKNKRKIGGTLVVAGLLLYYLFSITIVSNFLLSPLENKYSPLKIEDMEKADKVVLLLGGREADVLRGSEVLRISNLKAQKSKIIISGTNPLNPKTNEAEEVKEFLVERGIETENIILEDKSKTTKESAQNLKGLLDNKPFFLVTSAYHMKRAMETFKKLGFDPIPAPADFKREGGYDILDFFPDAQNLRNSDLAFHEYFGILFYKVL